MYRLWQYWQLWYLSAIWATTIFEFNSSQKANRSRITFPLITSVKVWISVIVTSLHLKMRTNYLIFIGIWRSFRPSKTPCFWHVNFCQQRTEKHFFLRTLGAFCPNPHSRCSSHLWIPENGGRASLFRMKEQSSASSQQVRCVNSNVFTVTW